MTVRNAFIFLLIGSLVAGALNVASRAFGPPVDEARAAQGLEQLKGRDLWVIGASTAASVVPEALSPNGGAFLSSSDIFESEAIVRHLLDSGERPTDIIVVIGPGITRADSGSRAGYGSDHRKGIYRVLYADGFRGSIGGDCRNRITGLLMPALGDQAWRPHVMWVAGLFDSTAPPGGNTHPTEPFTIPPSEFETFVRREAKIREDEYGRVAYYDSRVPERVGQSVARIAVRARRSGARAIFVAPPFADAAIDDLNRRDPLIQQEFRATMRIARAFGAVAIDTLRVKGISDDPSRYRDPKHLNQEGSIKYSDMLAGKLFDARTDSPSTNVDPQDGTGAAP